MIKFALILLLSLVVSSQAVAAVAWNNSKSNSQTDLSEFSVKPFKANLCALTGYVFHINWQYSCSSIGNGASV